MSVLLVVNRSFTSQAEEQFLPLGVRMLAAAQLPDTFWEKSQTTSKTSQTGQKAKFLNNMKFKILG